jgi:hypothetical protein
MFEDADIADGKNFTTNTSRNCCTFGRSLGFLLAYPTNYPKASICSPARFTPIVGVTPGAHYRTSIQELLHPELAFT